MTLQDLKLIKNCLTSLGFHFQTVKSMNLSDDGSPFFTEVTYLYKKDNKRFDVVAIMDSEDKFFDLYMVYFADEKDTDNFHFFFDVDSFTLFFKDELRDIKIKLAV